MLRRRKLSRKRSARVKSRKATPRDPREQRPPIDEERRQFQRESEMLMEIALRRGPRPSPDLSKISGPDQSKPTARGKLTRQIWEDVLRKRPTAKDQQLANFINSEHRVSVSRWTVRRARTNPPTK